MCTKKNWLVSIDAWIMQVFLSFHKILEETKFQLGKQIDVWWGGGGNEVCEESLPLPPSLTLPHSKLRPYVHLQNFYTNKI